MSRSVLTSLLVLTVCVALAGCPPASVTVPNVVGLSQSAASSAIVAAKLVVGNVTTEASDTVAAGNVISQSPHAGTTAANGAAVNLVVSTGPAVVLPSVGWSYVPANNAIWALTIDHTSDGGFIVGGGNTGYNMYALKLTSAGAYDWDATYSNLGPNDSELWRNESRGIRQTADGGYIMVGAGHNLNDLLPDKSYLLVKLDSAGEVTWSKAYAPENPYQLGHAAINDYAGALCVTADGGYAVMGSSYCGAYDLVSILKTDAAGTATLSEVINDNAKAYEEQIVAGQQTADGGYVLAGYSDNGAPEGYLALLIKVDGDGVLQWSQTYQYPPENRGAVAYAAIQTADGGYLIGGQLINSIQTAKASVYGCWLAKVDSTGTPVWSHSYTATPTVHYANAIKETPQGDFLVVGHISGNLTLSKFDASGVLLWNYSMDQFAAIGNDLVLTDDGGCVIAASGNTGGPSVIVKVNNVYTAD